MAEPKGLMEYLGDEEGSSPKKGEGLLLMAEDKEGEEGDDTEAEDAVLSLKDALAGDDPAELLAAFRKAVSLV